MANRLFSHIPLRRPKKNVFDLSHDVKLSLDMGQLIPIYVEDIIPGDKFRVRTEIMLRFAPMLAPIMHRVNVYTHFFFVPYRLLWKDWEDFITGGRTGSVSPVFPRYSVINGGSVSKGTLFDYLGFPAGQSLPEPGISFSKLPFFAYNLIYDQYYRDQNLESPIVEDSLPLASGITVVSPSDFNSSSAPYSLRYRAWEKDYFTSALPWAQRGGEVNLPISGELPVNGYLKSDPTQNYGQVNGRTQAGTANLTMNLDNPPSTPSGAFDLNLKADLGEGVSVTINDLRRSIKLQEWLEKNARGGARYIEQIFSHFGVKSSDARLQRLRPRLPSWEPSSFRSSRCPRRR